MTEELVEARQIVERAETRGLTEVEVVLRRIESALGRYARSEIHQNVVADEQVLTIRVARGGGLGQAVTGRLDPASIDAALDRAASLAREGSGWPGFATLGAGTVDLGAGAAVSASARAAAISEIVAAAEGVEVHGVVETVRESIAVAGSTGLVAATIRPSVWVVVLAVSGEGTGYAEQRSSRLDAIDVAALAREASTDARRTASTVAAPTHELPAVLSPYVTADLVAKTARLTLTGARTADGSSCFVPGLRLGSDLIDLVDDGHDAAGVPRPFDSEGVRRQRVPLMEGGLAAQVVHDTATAGSASTGHALGHPDTVGPLPVNLFLSPGTETDLTAGVEDGLLVRRVYYTNATDPRTVQMTGSTRDGLFRIRGGEVAEALAPARFSLSYLDVLRSVDAVGDRARTVAGWYGGVHLLGDVTVPPVRVGSFQLQATQGLS